jgi:hypothetical protein
MRLPLVIASLSLGLPAEWLPRAPELVAEPRPRCGVRPTAGDRQDRATGLLHRRRQGPSSLVRGRLGRPDGQLGDGPARQGVYGGRGALGPAGTAGGSHRGSAGVSEDGGDAKHHQGGPVSHEGLEAIQPPRSGITARPRGRPRLSADVAYGVPFLASDESSFMTGSELVIDGGYTAQEVFWPARASLRCRRPRPEHCRPMEPPSQDGLCACEANG